MLNKFPAPEIPTQKTLQERLLEIFPDLKNRAVQDLEKDKNRVAATQNRISDIEISHLLTDYSCNFLKLRENPDGTFSTPVTDHFSNDRLPPGYGYRGSAARALFERALGIKPDSIPRDIDIVRFSKDVPSNTDDKKILQHWIPDPEERRHGLEIIDEPLEYISNRDFTINEMFATDTEITFTRQCLLDTIRHIIRITDFELQELENNSDKKSKILAKALRLYSEGIYRWDDAAFANIPDWQFENYFITPFWLALQLDKACEVNMRVAETFVEELIKKNQIPKKFNTIELAAEYLVSVMWDKNFYYRHAPIEQFEIENTNY